MRTSDELAFLQPPRFRKRKNRSSAASQYLEAIENLWPDMDAAAQYASDHLAAVQSHLSEGEYELICGGLIATWEMSRRMRDYQESAPCHQRADPE